MRILTVCVSTNVFGAEIATLKMLEGLKQAGHEQLAITSIWTDGEFNRRLAQIGILEVRLPFGSLSTRLALRPLWWTANTLVRLPWLWVGWLRVVRRFEPDVTILTTWRHALVLYPFIGRRPSFLIEHTYLEPTKTRRVLYRLLARRLTGFVAVSEFMRGHTIKIGAPAKKVLVVKNGILSVCDFPRLLNRTFVANEIVKVGIVGRISRPKGHETLLEALCALRAQGVHLQVLVFGAGDVDYVSDISRKVCDRDLVHSWLWMGYAGSSDDIYPKLDICVMPSNSPESFGLAAAEAGAFGLPVIAGNCGGLPEIVDHGVTGFLVEPGNAAELADGLKWMTENPNLARSMGLKGREKVFREFTQERMVSDFEQIFAGSKRV